MKSEWYFLHWFIHTFFKLHSKHMHLPCLQIFCPSTIAADTIINLTYQGSHTKHSSGTCAFVCTCLWICIGACVSDLRLHFKARRAAWTSPTHRIGFPPAHQRHCLFNTLRLLVAWGGSARTRPKVMYDFYCSNRFHSHIFSAFFLHIPLRHTLNPQHFFSTWGAGTDLRASSNVGGMDMRSSINDIDILRSNGNRTTGSHGEAPIASANFTSANSKGFQLSQPQETASHGPEQNSLHALDLQALGAASKASSKRMNWQIVNNLSIYFINTSLLQITNVESVPPATKKEEAIEDILALYSNKQVSLSINSHDLFCFILACETRGM